MRTITSIALLVVGTVAFLGAVSAAGCTSAAPPGQGSTSTPAAGGAESGQRGQALAAANLAQWKIRNPERTADWVAEEKARHAIKPPFDNAYLLADPSATGQTYANYTKADLEAWTRETEKLVVEGSRIFHSGDALGSTVGVSCDMCHPDAANTHPETYPKFQAQMGRVALLRDMINWCIQQPVRGKTLAADSADMRALEAYIYAQRSGTPLAYGRH